MVIKRAFIRYAIKSTLISIDFKTDYKGELTTNKTDYDCIEQIKDYFNNKEDSIEIEKYKSFKSRWSTTKNDYMRFIFASFLE